MSIAVCQANAGREVSKGDMVAAQRLQRCIGVHHLVVGVGVQKLDRLVVHHLTKELRDGLALVEPLPAKIGQRLVSACLVQRDKARGPAIRKFEMVQSVE